MAAAPAVGWRGRAARDRRRRALDARGRRCRWSAVLALIGVTVVTNVAPRPLARAGGAGEPARCAAGVLALDIAGPHRAAARRRADRSTRSASSTSSTSRSPRSCSAPRWTWSLAGARRSLCYVRALPRRRGSGAHVARARAARSRCTSRACWWRSSVAAALTVYFVVRLVRRDRAARRRDRRDARAGGAERAARVAHDAGGRRRARARRRRSGRSPSSPRSSSARSARLRGRAAPLRDDARLIREEVERCRRILDQMAGDAGEHGGRGAGRPWPSRDLVARRAARRCPPTRRRACACDGSAARGRCGVPRRALAQALATSCATRSTRRGRRAACALRVDADERGAPRRRSATSGPGMTAEVLARAGRAVLHDQAAGQRAWASGSSSRARWSSASAAGSCSRSAPGAGATARARAAARRPGSVEAARGA